MTGGPRRVTFVTSPDECNLACGMCAGNSARARLARAGTPPRRLPFAIVERVLGELRGSPLTEVIPSTMGEPLLWPELPRLVDLCGAHDVSLNLTTNGTFPGGGAAAWAERLLPVASDVKISWNGATAATAEALMSGLSFAAAVANVRTLAAARDRARARGRRASRLSFQVTASEANVGELGDVIRLAAALGVERVKVNQLQVHSDALAPLSLRRSPDAIGRWNLAVRAMRAAAAGARLPSGAEVELQNAVELSAEGEPAPRGPCPFLGREAWIDAGAWFLPCPSPRAARGDLGDFGSVAEARFAEIWNGAAYRALVAGYAANPVCATCNFRRAGGA